MHTSVSTFKLYLHIFVPVYLYTESSAARCLCILCTSSLRSSSFIVNFSQLFLTGNLKHLLSSWFGVTGKFDRCRRGSSFSSIHMDRAHWRSPSFGGRSPHPRNPRFRGRGDFGGNPRHFSPHWQQRSPSPYRFQGHGSSPYGSQMQPRSPYEPQTFATSTPVHRTGRPFFRGGGRFNKRPSFGSPLDKTSDDVETWISPEMWSDPWRYLIPTPTTHSNRPDSSDVPSSYANLGCESEMETGTKFAESDFNLTDSIEAVKEDNPTNSENSAKPETNSDSDLESTSPVKPEDDKNDNNESSEQAPT